MFCTIRQYDDCKDVAGLLEKVQSELIPAIRDMAGYHSYIALDCGNDSVASISTFETEEQATEANDKVAALVEKTMADHISEPPTITIGEIKLENRR